MIVTSSKGGTLIGARSLLAGRVELLRGSQRVAALALPAGTPVVFGPGGNRLTLSRLTHPFKLGARVPLTLILETAGGGRQEIEVDAEVRRESPADAELRAHRH
jgi:copper(I)-binding protein